MKTSIKTNYENLDFLKEKIEKLNKKALKLNCNLITIENEKIEFIEDTETKEVKKMLSCDIIHDIIAIGNYKVLAQINHTYETGNIIKLIDNNFQVDEKYYSVSGQCEHCHINHKRKITYLIEDENMKIKQIGSTCLRDYSGYDIINILTLVEYIDNIQDMLDEETEKFNDGNRYAKYINTIHFLNVSKMVIDKFGFTSNSKAQENDTIPTSFIIKKILFGGNRYLTDSELEIVEKTKEMRSKNEVYEDVTNALLWLKNLNNIEIDNNYLRNLKTISSSEYFCEKEIGYMSSLLVAYFKANNDYIKKEKKEDEKISEYVGIEGQKIEISVIIKKIIVVDGYYGRSQLFVFHDENENILTWFSSSFNFEGEEDETVKIKATIKEHKEYEGKKQTVLLRVKKI